MDANLYLKSYIFQARLHIQMILLVKDLLLLDISWVPYKNKQTSSEDFWINQT